MADQLPAHPLSAPYGGKGPLIMRTTWVEASLAFVPFRCGRTPTLSSSNLSNGTISGQCLH